MFVHQQALAAGIPTRWSCLHLVANRCWESIERVRVTRALQASERRLRLAQRAGRIGSFEWLMKEKRMIWTPELKRSMAFPKALSRGPSRIGAGGSSPRMPSA